MSISGLVITLSDEAALHRLVGDARFAVGERDGAFVAVVLEAANDAEAERAVRDLGDAPGIAKVDVVYVQLADEEPLWEAACI
jgi:hypothetical protein